MLCGASPESTHLWDWPQWTLEVCARLPLPADRIRAPGFACLLPSVEGGGEGGCGQEQGVFSHPRNLPPPSRWRVKGGLGCASGLLEQKVLEHGLFSVPSAEVLPLSGPGFLREVPVPHLRPRVPSPSPGEPQVCRPVSGVARRGLRRWPCCGRVKGEGCCWATRRYQEPEPWIWLGNLQLWP